MSRLNLSTSCITYLAEKPSGRVQEFLNNSVAGKNQLSENTSLQSFDENIPADRIPQVIEELRQYEEYCVKNDQFFEADKCVKKIEQLQKKEVKFAEKTTKQVNKSEMSELEEMNLQQFQEFNEIWEKSIEDFKVELSIKETELLVQHESQLAEFDENAKHLEFPKTKYSPEVLQLRSLLEKLNKNKRYLESFEVKKRILELEVRDEQKWEATQNQKVAAQRVLLLQKQRQELQALQSKLENQLQLKIRARKSEMDKYAQWLMNMKQELTVTHGLELSRIVSQGDKRNSKVAGGLCNTSMLLNSQILDISKAFTPSNAPQTN